MAQAAEFPRRGLIQGLPEDDYVGVYPEKGAEVQDIFWHQILGLAILPEG